MESLREYAEGKLSAAARRAALRTVRPGRATARTFDLDGRRYVAFASNDYLGLAQHPSVIEAAEEALAELGSGALASRLVVGTHPLYQALEHDLAQLKQTEAACVFGSGYHANLGVIPAVVSESDVIILDELAHACLHAGARLAGGRRETYRHNDPDALRTILQRTRGDHPRALVVSEGVFSMDGDAADLASLAAVCAEHDAWLLIDDAHATGVVGEGRGSVAEQGLRSDRVPLQVGTLSKAFAGYGGFLAAEGPVVELMHTRARTLIYSTGLPPSVVAASRAALRASADEPWRRRRVRALARRLADALGLPPPNAAIVPVPIGTNDDVLRVHRSLAEAGLWVPAMRPPTVPEGTARLRVSLSAAHEDDDVERLITQLKRMLGGRS